MDRITRAQARLNLVRLGVSPLALDIFDGARLPHDLNMTFSTPYFVLDDCENLQKDYGKGPITPLWADGDVVTAYHHDPDRRGYFRFDVEESGEKEVGLNRLSWNQMVAYYFFRMYEHDKPENVMRELASLFAFGVFDHFLQSIKQSERKTYEQAEAWEQAFILSIA